MPSPVALDAKVPFSWEASAQRTKSPPRLFALTRALLVATLLVAPLPFGAVQEWAWGGLAVLAFLLLLLWSIGSVQQGAMRIVWSPLYVPAGLLFILGMIQFFGHLTMDPIATRESLLKLAADLILFFMATQPFGASAPARSTLAPLGERADPLRQVGEGVGGPPAPPLRWTIVVYSFLLALFAIFQFFSSHGLIYWTVKSPGWTFGPYVNHNHYAGLMEMLIPIMVASVLTVFRKTPSLPPSYAVSSKASGQVPRNLPARLACESRAGRESSTSAVAVFLGCVVLIPVVSVLLSGSRGGLISLAVEVLLAAVLIFLRGPASARKTTAVLGSSALVAAALLFVWMAPRQSLERLETVVDITHSPEVGLADRLVASRDSLRILRDHPWVGAGLGSFETVFPRYQSFPGDLTWDHTHNDYAEALAETGAAGGALILFALGLFFWLAFGNLRERLRHRAGWIQFGAALGCCGLLVHSFADFNLHIPANAAWFAVCAALGAGARNHSRF
jgi:O-antigen ligase